MAKILLIDSERIIREGLKLFLQFNLDAEVSEAATLEEGVHTLITDSSELILVNLPVVSTTILGSVQSMKSLRPEVPILLLGSLQDNFHRMRFLQAGAAGYVSRSAEPAEFIRAVETLLSGGNHIPQDLSRELISSPTRESALHELLSNRELQVFILMASGKTSTEIAAQLHLSIKTVSTYKIRITEKTGLSTKYEMAQYATAHKLI
ncbi:MAG: response regulator transcription factor [Bacteroidota bacterium]